jgi:hypothetical protein
MEWRVGVTAMEWKHDQVLKALVVLAAALSLTACGGHGDATSSGPTTITLSPQPASVPVNGTVTFTATAANAGSGPIWFLAPGGQGGAPGTDIGTLNSGNDGTATYTAPPAPPVFGPEGQGKSSVQGVVMVTAGVLGPGGNLNGPTATVSFAITAPEVTTGITPATATVALGATVEFYGYAVGNVDNGITWQVNGVAGGSAATGTIVNTGYVPPSGSGYVWPGTYTAPATMPMSGNTVTVTAVSQADSTKSSSAVVTLN